MANANLIITYNPAHPGKAMAEAKALLEAAGESPEFLKSEVDGIFLAVVGNPKGAVRKLLKTCETEPEKFSCTFKWSPIETWCSSDMADMAQAVRNLESRIGGEESWKLELTKRKYDKHSTTDLIAGLTEGIDRPKVDLKNPDKIIKVDIISSRAAVSLLDAGEYLDTQKIKKR